MMQRLIAIWSADRLCRLRAVWLASPRIYLLAVLVSVLLPLPSVFTGFSADDYFLRTITLQNHFIPNLPESPFDAFVFIQNDHQGMRRWIEQGLLPWWTDPEIKVAFWRPLSALTHWLDFKMYPAMPWLMHVHNLLWYGLLSALVLVLYRRFFSACCGAGITAAACLQTAGLAALMYAADDARGLGVGWISNRNAIVAAVWALSALLLHDSWRRRGSAAAAALAPVCLGLGLLGGESAVAVCGYLFAYAVFMDRGRLLPRLCSLIPAGIVVVAWRIVYQRLGYGAIGTDLYLDPGQNPAGFLAELVQRLPVLLLGQLGMPNSAAWTVVPGYLPALMFVFALLFLAFCLWMLWPLLRRDRLSRFFAAGMVLAAIPSCATYPNDRLLFMAGIGGMGLIACYLAWLWQGFKKNAPRAAGRPAWAAGALFVVWTGIHMVVNPLLLPGASITSLMFQRPLDRGAATLPPQERGQAVIVNLPIDMMQPYVYLTHAYSGTRAPAPAWLLSAGITAVEVETVDAHTVIIRPEEGLFRQPWDRVFRGASRSLAPGDEIRLSGMTALVTKINAEGRPCEIRYRFEKAITDPHLQWLAWSRTGFVPFTPPRAGERIILKNPTVLWWL